MKKLLITFGLLFFASVLFVNCNKDDADEIIEEILEIDPFDAELNDTGTSYAELLKDDMYTSLTVEFAFTTGHRPAQSTLDSFKRF